VGVGDEEAAVTQVAGSVPKQRHVDPGDDLELDALALMEASAADSQLSILSLFSLSIILLCIT